MSVSIFISRYALYLPVCIICSLAVCKNAVTLKAPVIPAKASAIDTLQNQGQSPILDTTITLSGIRLSGYHGIALTDSLAKEVLYNHYRSKGYFTSDNVPEMITDSIADVLVVHYGEIIPADINNDKYMDAVISFWLIPLGASGNCWQPDKAIIIDMDSGYVINNEEFIPSNFSLDSIVKSNDKLVLYGYDYDCSSHENLSALRITLNTSK